jgi:hypothetical protein
MLRKRNQQTHIETRWMARSKQQPIQQQQQMQHLEQPKYQQEEC